jgi:hypothetical protein
VSGGIVFSGTAPITFVPATPTGTTYTLTVSGGISLTGSSLYIRSRTQTTSGGYSFGGVGGYNRIRSLTPNGGFNFTGVQQLIRTRVEPVSGAISLGGHGSTIFIPSGGSVVIPKRTMMGAGI